ncbi:Myosin Large ATPase [Rhizoctonia solani]|uniref:Myosin Large ATPase n=1 Tax=Rhizoctonia solani TaxID=456999 RepID=A0A8H7HFI6_9AGAM|nr:Myosin Large ATPase [Rhizoctonia solani]
MAPSKKAGKKGAAAAAKKGGPAKVQKADWKEGFKKKQVGVSDMTLLTTISNDSVNDNLEKRWKNGEIYTYIGQVLISVNPFRGMALDVSSDQMLTSLSSLDLGIYTEAVLESYKGKNRLEMPPHVFAIAESSYYNMKSYKENQCVIISGESGAGKTEAAKRIMQYIAAVSGGQDSSITEIKEMVLATNPLLESFGCAKTLRNDNSSRHGKYLEIMFNSNAEPIGAQITNYLLEKGRVVGQINKERDFHIFYQFTKGASDEQREAFGLQGPDAYSYTSRSNCLDVASIDDVKDFHDTLQAMNVVGLTAEEQNDIFRMIAAILWIGNIQFVDSEDGSGSTITDTGVTDFVAYLLEVDAAMVSKAMVSKTMETQRGGRRGSVYDVPLNPAQAAAGRDALAKAIYNNLFEWIVSRVNISMKPRQATVQVIGVLDIYGFEIFQNNSFEQLCINYVNEKLQQIFIELTLKTEQEEYVREQIKWTPIEYFNNKIVCDLIEERRPPGIFAALNDATATAHADPAAADSSFIQRSAALASNPHFESRGGQFLVKHYAGDVMYTVAGMTDKNKDALVKDLTDLIIGSGNAFLQTLFPDRPDPNSKKRPPSAGDKIKASAGALVENLMRSQPAYIRTIKPNQSRSATEYDNKAILHQIKYLGLQENIRVRRAGFAYRNTFEKMVERFYLLSPNTSYAGEYTWTGDARSGCEKILTDVGIAKDEWQMGVTKAFIKNPETLFALETMRDRYWHNMAARIQRAWRNYMRYKNEAAARIQRFWKNNKEGIVHAETRQYGHDMLNGRKERRRYSLLGYRRFLGDYLDVGGRSALGETIKDACGIAGGETVHFSSRCQLLVSKLGRSSKPSPRYIVLTEKAVYLAVTTAKDGRIATTLDRKVQLVTIRSVAMSNLRDDWMALNVNACEEGDPVISLEFKTEFTASLMKLTHGQANLLIGPTVEYAKKKEKKQLIKFVKDETVPRDDVYKSHTVHVPTGEPANSQSRPVPKPKPGQAKPITQGKLLRKGGPSNSSRPTPKPKPKPAAQPLPGQISTPTAASRSVPTPPSRSAAPPPPPPPAAEPEVPTVKVLYDFAGQPGEMSLTKGEILELVEKDKDGWTLVKKNGTEGWAPSDYLQIVPPKPKPAPAAPPPPTRRVVPPPAPTPAAPTPPPAPAVVPKPAVGGAKPPIVPKSVAADASAKPVSVFPGVGGGSGPTPWKKPATTSSAPPPPPPPPPAPAAARPVPAAPAPPPAPPRPTPPGGVARAVPPVAGRAVPPKPPALAAKPPPIAPKPGGIGGAPKPPGAKPPVPAARPAPAASGGGAGGSGIKPPAAPPGQMDLATMLARRAGIQKQDD